MVSLQFCIVDAAPRQFQHQPAPVLHTGARLTDGLHCPRSVNFSSLCSLCALWLAYPPSVSAKLTANCTFLKPARTQASKALMMYL